MFIIRYIHGSQGDKYRVFSVNGIEYPEYIQASEANWKLSCRHIRNEMLSRKIAVYQTGRLEEGESSPGE